MNVFLKVQNTCPLFVYMYEIRTARSCNGEWKDFKFFYIFVQTLGHIFFNQSLNTQLMLLFLCVNQETDRNNKYEF